MVSGLNEPRERCGICRDDRIGTREAAEIMSAELTGARPGATPASGSLQSKPNIDTAWPEGQADRGRFDATRRDTSSMCPRKAPAGLQRALGFDSPPPGLARSSPWWTGSRGSRSPWPAADPRQSIKGREHARTYRRQGKWWQVMTFDEMLRAFLMNDQPRGRIPMWPLAIKSRLRYAAATCGRSRCVHCTISRTSAGGSSRSVVLKLRRCSLLARPFDQTSSSRSSRRGSVADSRHRAARSPEDYPLHES